MKILITRCMCATAIRQTANIQSFSVVNIMPFQMNVMVTLWADYVHLVSYILTVSRSDNFRKIIQSFNEFLNRIFDFPLVLPSFNKFHFKFSPKLTIC